MPLCHLCAYVPLCHWVGHLARNGYGGMTLLLSGEMQESSRTSVALSGPLISVQTPLPGSLRLHTPATPPSFTFLPHCSAVHALDIRKAFLKPWDYSNKFPSKWLNCSPLHLLPIPGCGAFLNSFVYLFLHSALLSLCYMPSIHPAHAISPWIFISLLFINLNPTYLESCLL